MKKIIYVFALVLCFNVYNSNAQSSYKTAVGLGFDFSGGTLVGPSAKFFLTDKHAVQAELMFESGVTAITGLYEYHQDIESVDGLKWFAGAGPTILFYGNGFGTKFALRPTAGLDYKLDSVPLTFSFDWRPFIGVSDVLGNKVGSFGLGIRYVLN